MRLQKNSIFYQSWFSDAERVKNQIDLNEIQNNKQRNQSIEEVMLDIETNLKLTLVQESIRIIGGLRQNKMPNSLLNRLAGCIDIKNDWLISLLQSRQND